MSNIERKPVVNGDEVVEKKQTLTEVLGCSPMSIVMSSFTKQFLIPKMKGFIFEGITYIVVLLQIYLPSHSLRTVNLVRAL